jgi:hypothetical protein
MQYLADDRCSEERKILAAFMLSTSSAGVPAMPKAKQLTLSHENLPGMLASIAKVLGNEKVNILSCLTMTSGTTGTTYVVVDNVEKAKKALANARLTYTEADVL